MREAHYVRMTAGAVVIALGWFAWRSWVELESAPPFATKPRWTAANYAHAARAVAALGGPLLPAPTDIAARVEIVDEQVAVAPPPQADAPAPWEFVDGDARFVRGPEGTEELASLANGFTRESQRVRVSFSAFDALARGSLVPLELPSGERYLARVENLVAHEGGDRSWTGHLDGFGSLHPVVFTQGDVATFATIAAPGGLYALEAYGEDGVLFRDEREELHDASQACELYPD
ncbi:MAG: hypothetical protein L6Q99_03395 [Planctomycetes bacterium]|nr:hypothetical protein [Planctomycetota bacterium]